jgi:hypothetical protein
MNSSPLTLPTDRLIDYFCVCGPGDELAPVADGAVSYATVTGRPHPTRTEFLPRLLDRFPALDYPDTPFPTGVADFCFPNQVRLVRPRRGQTEPLPAAFSFIATGAKGERLVGHVLVFWEALSPGQAACVDPLAPAPSPTTAAAAAASSSSSSLEPVSATSSSSDRLPSGSSAVMTPVLDDVAVSSSGGGGGSGDEGVPAELAPTPTPADARTVIVRSASADSAFGAGSTGGEGGTAAADALTAGSSSGGGDGLPTHDTPSAPQRSSSTGAAGGVGGGSPDAATVVATTAQAVAPRGSRGSRGSGAHAGRAPLTVYAPKCVCLLSRWAFPAFRTLLTEFYRLSLTAQTLPLERLVVNFTCEVRPGGVGAGVRASGGAWVPAATAPGLAPTHRCTSASIPHAPPADCVAARGPRGGALPHRLADARLQAAAQESARVRHEPALPRGER